MTNRAIARRTMFETREDIEEFVRLVGNAAAKGWIEVHAFVVMATHFHLLVRCPSGGISRALREIQREYVRYFNRRRRRDGPLLRGRFRALRVASLAYRRAVVAYLDRNPVDANIVRLVGEYEFSSADAYLGGSGPEWLERSWIEEHVKACLGVAEISADAYLRVFHAGNAAAVAGMVERRLRRDDFDVQRDPTDSLLGGAAPAVRSWFRRKAQLADGTAPGQVLVDGSVLMRLFEPLRASKAEAPRPKVFADPWARRLAWLLHAVAGETYLQIGQRLGVTGEATRRAVTGARAEAATDELVLEQLSELVYAALEDVYGVSAGGGRSAAALFAGC